MKIILHEVHRVKNSRVVQIAFSLCLCQQNSFVAMFCSSNEPFGLHASHPLISKVVFSSPVHLDKYSSVCLVPSLPPGQAYTFLSFALLPSLVLSSHSSALSRGRKSKICPPRRNSQTGLVHFLFFSRDAMFGASEHDRRSCRV